MVPNTIVDYTAIGRVTARYFVINLSTEYGCCANTAYSNIHLIVHSRTPKIMDKPKVPKPANWNPIVAPVVLCNQMMPFVLSPMPQIPFHNMPDSNTTFVPKV